MTTAMTSRFKTTVACLCALLPLLAWQVSAQTLSSPLPAGQGAGAHGAGSPFAPLEARQDVIAWSVLTDVKTKTE